MELLHVQTYFLISPIMYQHFHSLVFAFHIQTIAADIWNDRLAPCFGKPGNSFPGMAGVIYDHEWVTNKRTFQLRNTSTTVCPRRGIKAQYPSAIFHLYGTRLFIGHISFIFDTLLTNMTSSSSSSRGAHFLTLLLPDKLLWVLCMRTETDGFDGGVAIKY